MKRAVQPCAKYLCLGCSLPQDIETCYSPDFPCMGDVLDSIPKRNRLIQDSREQGYACLGCEDFIALLNRKNYSVLTTDLRQGGLQNFTKGNPITPNDVAVKHNFQATVDSYPYHHGRPSQYSSSKCPLSVLMSNIDQDMLESITGRIVQEQIETVAGDVRHKIVSHPNLMHEKAEFSMFATLRKDYTEKRVVYSFNISGLEKELDLLFDYMTGKGTQLPDVWDVINFEYERRYYKDWFSGLPLGWLDSGISNYVLKGTVDMILGFEHTNDVVIGDWKRSRYWKNAFGMQMGSYALAVEQLLGIEPEAFFLICAINNYHNRPDDYKLHTGHIVHLKKDDILFKTLKLKSVFLHTVMMNLVHHPDSFISLRNLQRKPRNVEGHEEVMCDVLYSGVPCIQLKNDMCNILYDYLIQGGDLNKLLIKGFQVKS